MSATLAAALRRSIALLPLLEEGGSDVSSAPNTARTTLISTRVKPA